MGWYTSSVGETPCTTYQRLRQSCNPTFQVGVFPTSSPPDVCTDQVSTCCCNSVAFSLAMLCVSCQRGIGDNDLGRDAPAGTYQAYLGSCKPSTNGSLPSLTQQAVCNQDIVLPKYVFVPFWGDGTWFYKYVREAAQLQITSGTNDTGACPQKKSDAGVAGTKTLAIVGGVLGGVILVLSGTLAWCGFKLFQLRRENERRDLASEPYAPSPVSQAQRPQSAVTFAQYSPVEMHSPSPVPQSAPQLISPPQPQPPQPQHQTQSHSQYISSRPIKSAYPAPPNLQDHSPSPLEHRSRVAGPRPPLRSATSNSTSGGSSGSPSHESRSGSARASLLPPSYYVR